MVDYCFSCTVVEGWIRILSFIDTLTDFIYFGKLLRGDDVDEGIAYMVLGFALCGMVANMVGPVTQCGLTTATLLEDVPQIICTTAIEAYIVGADLGQWTPQAVASYVFSIIALQQKFVQIGYAPKYPWQKEDSEEKDNFWWIVVCSGLAVILTLVVAWGIALLVILFS